VKRPENRATTAKLAEQNNSSERASSRAADEDVDEEVEHEEEVVVVEERLVRGVEVSESDRSLPAGT